MTLKVMVFAALLLLALAPCGCGDILAYPIRHGNGSDEPLGPAGPDDVYAPPKTPATSAPDPTEITPPPPSSDGGSVLPGCRPPLGWDPSTYCVGALPKATVDHKPIPITEVRANGVLPTFAFDLLDAPARLIVRLGPTGQTPAQPSKLDLSQSGEQWDSRIWKASCSPGPDCPQPKDWLSIARGDHLSGWVTFRTEGGDRYTSLCLAVTRGASHVGPMQLPCSVVVYTPDVAIR